MFFSKQKFIKLFLQSLFLLAFNVSLFGCGGEDSGSDPSTTDTDTGPITNSTPGNIIWSTSAAVGPIQGSPALAADGTIYVFTQNAFGVTGRLVALNPNGTKKWEFDVGANFVGSFSTPSIGSDGTIYVGSSNGLVAISPDGTGRWTFPVLSYSSSPAIGADGTIYVTESSGYLTAVNPDGTLKWTVSMGDDVNLFAGGITIAPNGNLYLGTDDNLIRAYNNSGTLLWTHDACGGSRPLIPAIPPDGGEIYVACDNGFVIALDPNGVGKWTQNLEGGGSSISLNSNNTLYVAAGNYLYRLDPFDGTAIWSFNAGHSVSTTPAIGDDEIIYFSDKSAKFFAINPLGTREWFVDSGSLLATEGSPVIGSNGIVYFTTGAGKVVAVGSSSTGPAPGGWPMFMNNAQHTGRAK